MIFFIFCQPYKIMSTTRGNTEIAEYIPKKGLDIWLNDKGYYRKHVALDETCLFRAVSDQVHNTQIYHEDLRSRCIKYALEHRAEFKNWVDDWDDHIFKLKNHLLICGDMEIEILSRILKRDFIIFNPAIFCVNNVTKHGYKDVIMLCRLKDNHFDSVFETEKIEKEGFCQSLVYKLLYEEVFKVENVDSIVDTMLNQSKLSPTGIKESTKLDSFDLLLPKRESKKSKSNFVDSVELRKVPETEETYPPFPYKVAKALDPNQYRNLAYDAWTQDRKDMRMKNWYLGGNDFKVGTKCLIVVNGRSLNCYIQEMNYGFDGGCLVYIVETAERRQVKLKDLCPPPNAKAWPLPYYVSRNNQRSKASLCEYRDPKDYRKRKYQKKRRNYGDGAVSWLENSYGTENYDMQSIASLEGCPFIASMCSQFTDTLQLDDPEASRNGHFDPVLYNNNNNNCELFADLASNHIVHYDSVNQYSMQSFVPTVQDSGLPMQNVPLIIPQKSVIPNGMDIPFYDIYSLRYNFNLGFEYVCQNYWQMWLPPIPGVIPAPFMTPKGPIAPPHSPQMSVAAEFNMIQHNSSDNKLMFCSQYIKESFNLNNNNTSIRNLNYECVPTAEPPLDFIQELPYTCPPPNINVPRPNINVPPPTLPLGLNFPGAPYSEVPPPYMAPLILPVPSPVQYYTAGLPPLSVPPSANIPLIENLTSIM